MRVIEGTNIPLPHCKKCAGCGKAAWRRRYARQFGLRPAQSAKMCDACGTWQRRYPDKTLEDRKRALGIEEPEERPVLDRSFMENGSCRLYEDDPTLWDAVEFCESPFKMERVTEAKRICGFCSVRTECLTYALSNKEWGVWGGVYLSNGKPVKKPGRKMNEREEIAA